MAASGTRVPIEKLQIKIGGMQCSFCVMSIEKAVRQIGGVTDISVSLTHEEALVQYDPARASPLAIQDTLKSLGYTVRDPNKVRTFEEEEAELRRERNRLFIVGIATATALGLMVPMWLGFHLAWIPWVMLALALATMFGPARYIKRMAWASLRRRIFNQHVLLEFAAFGGLAGGAYGFLAQPWPTADFLAVSVFVTTYHVLSGYTSLLVRTRASQAIKKLMALQPPVARVVRDGQETEVPIADVRPGDLVRVRPGESIPVDGVVVEGASGVDQSLVTGESIPVEKLPGAEVIGGSILQTGTLLVRVTKVGAESFLQRVAQHIQEARALKPGIVILVDRVLTFFVPGVLLAAALAVLVWTLGAWLAAGEPAFPRAIFAALAVLVMGYPCALGMATPLAMIRGGGMAAQRGILMRSGEAFQVFKDVRKVVLDKTGTLTRGQPQIVELAPDGGHTPQSLLALAASIEAPSEHPLARAVVDRALDEGLEFYRTSDFVAVAGRGVRCKVDGRTAGAGSPRFLAEEGIDLGAYRQRLEALESRGATVIAVAEDGRLAGTIAIADTLKEDAHEAVARMRSAGMEPVLLTGDNWRTARAVAEQVGIAEVFAEVLPQDKAARVRELQRQGYRVAMVGDGINDAPALVQADVGIAIGAGTDIAMEAADIVLVGEGLGGVVEAYHIAKSSYAKTVQNVALALSINGVGVPAAITGFVHPVWAMIAMAASVSTVLLNSFGGRLLPRARFRAGPRRGS